MEGTLLARHTNKDELKPDRDRKRKKSEYWKVDKEYNSLKSVKW